MEREGAAPRVPFPRAIERWPTLRQSLLSAFDTCALEARLAYELEYDAGVDDPDRMQWHTMPQASGQIFHQWASKLLNELADLGQDALADDVECRSRGGCGLLPNEALGEAIARGEVPPREPYREKQPCPNCGKPLGRAPLSQHALTLLVETLRQEDQDPRDVVRVPQAEVKNLEWITTKFAREQRFKIANFVDCETRLEATLEYPNPYGGTVRRTMTGQYDALFMEQLPDGTWHAFILDWKSGWAIPGRTTISSGGYFQQRFYAWLLMKNDPLISKVTLDEVYVRYKGGVTGRDNHRTATITRDKMGLIEMQLAVVAEAFDRAMEAWLDYRAVAAEHAGSDTLPESVEALIKRLRLRSRALFLPSPGSHCNYCPLPHRCPIVDDIRVHGTIRNEEDAKRVANELVVVTRAKKHREEALRGYLERRRSAPVTVAIKDDEVKLRKYTDNPPGLPEGVPLKTAKGRKAYALVESTRNSSPDRDTVEEMLALAARGVEVDMGDYYRAASSTTMRLVEERLPTDEAAEVSPDIERALARSVDRLEQVRAAS
jgi:hypothetical protein